MVKIDPIRAKIAKIYRSPLFKTVQTIAVVMLAVFSVYRWRHILLDSLPTMMSIPIWGVFLLFASQLFMYYCNAKLFYLPLHHRRQCPMKSLWRVSMELNFINTAIPYGEGLGFLWIQRLGRTRTARTELRWVFFLRYFISILTNNLLSLLAMFWIRSKRDIEPNLCTAVIVVNGIFIAVCTVAIAVVFLRFYRPPKGTVLPFLLWGLIYSIAEDASYWVIAASLGHPEFFPAIFIGTVAGDIIGELSPLPAGIGLYEVPMITALSVLGVDLNLATAFTLAGRTWVLLLMLPIGFFLALFSSLSEGKKSILDVLENQRAINDHDKAAPPPDNKSRL